MVIHAFNFVKQLFHSKTVRLPQLKEQEKFKLYKLGKRKCCNFIPNILIGQHLLHNSLNQALLQNLQTIPDYHENLQYMYLSMYLL